MVTQRTAKAAIFLTSVIEELLITMHKSDIVKIYGESYKDMTMELLEYCKLAERIPDTSVRIGIKPNLVAPSEASWGATTHPEVVAGIIEYLQNHGFFNLIMLESSWVGDKTSDSIEVCGYDKLIEKYHVPFIDLQKDSHTEKDCAGMALHICDTVETVDFLINVPVLKGHCQTKMTCALKNMKGLIPNTEKRHFHACGLHKPIAHLNAYLHQDFIVVDHICGDLDFEDGGNPVTRNCLMAGCDPVLMDAYCCGLLHIPVEDVPYIGMSAALGVGSTDVEQAQVTVIGEKTKWNELDLPYATKVVELKDAVEEVDSCSACYGYLLPALDMLKEDGLFDKLQEKICIGQGYRGKTGQLGVGNCTAKFDFCIKGCPPTEQEIYEQLKAYILQ